MGYDIVTGGGPGLMRAANEGARAGAYHYKTRSFGLTILPMEEQPNPFLDEVNLLMSSPGRLLQDSPRHSLKGCHSEAGNWSGFSVAPRWSTISALMSTHHRFSLWTNP
jgi:hypothetical protein